MLLCMFVKNKSEFMRRRKKVPLHLQAIRGSIGKELVIKHYSWGIVMTKFPDMRGIIASAKQRKCRNIFKEAVAYAQAVIADPVKKAEWQSRIKRRNGVYNKAIKAYMLKLKCDTEREALLELRKMRLAFKNAVSVKKNNVESPAGFAFSGEMITKECFLETG